MRSKIIQTLSLTLLILYYGCGSINYGNSISKNISTTTNMNGYWGNWKETYSLKVYLGRAVINTFETITLYSSSHPSDLDFEIVSMEYVGKDDKWYKYKGVVNVNCFKEYYDGLGEHYQNKTDLSNCTDNKTRFSCEILSSHLINDVVKKRGTINVFYNGVGRGYSFKNY